MPLGAGVDIRPAAAAASAFAEKRALDSSRAPAASHRLGTIAKSAIGPFVARAGDSGLAAWMVAADRGGQELFVVPLAGDGAPLGEPRVVATVPQEATTLVVRPAGGTHGGWLLEWSALLDRGESLTVLGLTPDGTARGPAVDLERTSDHIKWCDAIPTSRGVVGVWAEETSAGDANILATAIDGEGKPLGMPVRVARGVDRWQAVPFGDGVGLALATVDSRDERSSMGRLGWLRLDAQAHPQGDVVAVGSRATVNGDVDAVPLPEGALLAWTDRTGEDAQVVLALVDAAGHVTGPSPAMDSVGGSSLVALASGAHAAALAWEEPAARTHPQHALHLAAVSTAEGRLSAQPVTSVEVASGVNPELVATGTGFALLASAHACMGEGRPALAEVPWSPPWCASMRASSRCRPSRSFWATAAPPQSSVGGSGALATGASCWPRPARPRRRSSRSTSSRARRRSRPPRRRRRRPTRRA